MTNPRSPNPGSGRECDASSWSGFLDTFHDQRPGITAEILRSAAFGMTTPYGWLVKAIPGTGAVVDVACGNGPLAELIGRRWIGTDRSESELTLGMAEHALPSVVSDAANLPFATNATDTVVCSMALHVTQPLPSVLAEIARVLRPGGQLVAIIPARHPLTLRDRWRYLSLIRILGDGLSSPNDQALRHLPELIGGAGLELVSDEFRRFEYPIESRAAAERFVSSLYLRDVTSARLDAAHRLAHRWVGTALGIPIHRFACASPTAGSAPVTLNQS